LLVFLYRSQNRARIGFRQVEIEENQAGPGSSLIRRDLSQEPERLLTIRRDTKINGRFQASQGLSDEAYIARVVLHN
jgi:hypothetical protein